MYRNYQKRERREKGRGMGKKKKKDKKGYWDGAGQPW
jgi:hypothetical protein